MSVMNVDINGDVSKLTSIPEATLDRLANLSEDVVCHTLLESLEDESDELHIYFGYGVLNIRIVGDEVVYKFVPSDSLQTKVKTTIIKRESPVIKKLEQRLVTQITDTYKELL